MRLPVRAAVTAATLLLSMLVVIAPGQAAVYASTGQRCTKVGTTGADTLRGTRERDVLCGRGGDDTLLGGGGDDVIDAGRGADRLGGGYGSDVLLGWSGADHLRGGAGLETDRLHGGGGGDQITGGGGADRLWGDAGADSVLGGADDDAVSGGFGGDLLDGGDGSDELEGEDGDDDITGGPGPDLIDGGLGTNWCLLDAEDTQHRCLYDTEAPQAGELWMSASSVDVTDQGRTVTFEVRVTDDTGVESVDFNARSRSGVGLRFGTATLVEGTVRDGVWRASAHVSKWTEPGVLEVDVTPRDRVGRWQSRFFGDVFSIANRDPDTELPHVALLEPAFGTSVDVRDAGGQVVIEARITDTQSGVAYGSSFALELPVGDGFAKSLYGTPRLVSGTPHDGIWRAVVNIPRGSTGGDWNVRLIVRDQAHPYEDGYWMGPDSYRYWTSGPYPDPNKHQFPDGLGRVGVIGTHDSTAAEITSADITPAEVDTLPGAATVHVRIHATDARGEGVSRVSANLHGEDTSGSGPHLPSTELSLTSGTNIDGTWEGDLILPQGTPPGTYYLAASVADATHTRYYVAASSPNVSQPDRLILTEDPRVTVIDNPAG